MAYSPLSKTQIEQLTHQGCSAGDWTGVSLSPTTDLSRITDVQFFGTVQIGSTRGSILCDGIDLPCGLYHAVISGCTIGDNVRIARIGSVVSNYDIEADVLIQDVAALAADQDAQSRGNFGNGIKVDTVNEGGGRSTILLNDLTAQVAFLQAMYRGDIRFTERLSELIKKKITMEESERGVVGTGARVIHCGSIHNVNIGPYAHIHGTALLENGTVLSCREHPTEIGDNVQAVSFIVSEGAAVTGGAVLKTVFVGQGANIGRQFSAENSLFFANCEGFNGEAVSLFCGPYTVTHHKSTLLIAGLFSFFNAGSGTNQSNHMYKLGPVHQGIFERGCKTGSFSYMLHETLLGPFTVLIGKHYTNINTPNLPFSTIREEDGTSTIFPGRNLSSIGMVRDGEKWPARDNRMAPRKRDLIIFDVFTPYTVEKMRRGRKDLLALSEAPSSEKKFVRYGGLQISHTILRKGADNYTQAIVRYLAGGLCTRLMKALEKSGTWVEAVSALKPSGTLDTPTEWADIAGLIAPRERIQALVDEVRSGRIKSYDAMLEHLDSIYQGFRNDEWEYIYTAFTDEFGIAPSALSKAVVMRVIDVWADTARSMLNAVLEDAKREFGASAMIGYGVDQGDEERTKDFEAVRGSAETNSIVRKLINEGAEFSQLISKCREMIASAAE
jgi:hypothetical protein